MRRVDEISPPPRLDDTTLFAIIRQPVTQEIRMKNPESGFGRLALLAFGIPWILAVIGNHTLGRFEDSADRMRLEAQEREPGRHRGGDGRK